jgi:hypothetical protein
MKKLYRIVFLLIYVFAAANSKGQAGYIILNEYMPWTTNTCSVNGEFIELYNLGPGPVNIGCYIVTDGDFSITIPPNTIVNAGQFFVLGGDNVIPTGCANINGPTTVNLNWNTCNCTSSTIPTTGDGLMTDGGSANEQIVLFDPNLKVVDAVARNLPVETASAITTSTISGGCVSKSYDLDTMTVNYETIGESAGRGNSFARKINGDCDWDKDPQQSAGATNNKAGSASSLTSTLSITNATSCSNNGSISISFSGVSNYSTIFPIQYILGKDVDSNNVFNLSDTYVSATDSIAPTVDISGLAAGRYKIALQPKSGCNYQFYEFTILPCGTVILKPNAFAFYASRITGAIQLTWTADNIDRTQKFEIEKSLDGMSFKKIQSYSIFSSNQPLQNYKYYDLNSSPVTCYYRIKIYYDNNTIAYSSVKIIEGIAEDKSITLFPNPVKDFLNINFESKNSQHITLMLLQADSKILQQKKLCANIGYNKIIMETSAIQAGMYYLKLYQEDGSTIIKKIYKQ